MFAFHKVAYFPSQRNPVPTLAALGKQLMWGKIEQTAVRVNILVIHALTCCKYKSKWRLKNDTTLPPTVTYFLQPVALSQQKLADFIAAIATLPSAPLAWQHCSSKKHTSCLNCS